ncbi:MAG: hypothetical protein HQK56_09675 [Deltaproteobacteria bacterium]|nr:hypothetical protein [Deltaproteobacteria bacterium]
MDQAIQSRNQAVQDRQAVPSWFQAVFQLESGQNATKPGKWFNRGPFVKLSWSVQAGFKLEAVKLDSSWKDFENSLIKERIQYHSQAVKLDFML